MFIILWILLTLILSVVIGFVVNYWLAAPSYKGLVSDHFDGERFYNYGKYATDAILPEQRNGSLWKWILNRPKNEWQWRENTPHPTIVERVEGAELVVTYINHATVLLQTEGLNIITDPVWSNRVSPFTFMGPKRYRPVGIALDELPSIDVILLSHNHYDHLDLASLRAIVAIHKPKIFTSLGNAAYLASHGITGAIDMDWWSEQTLKEGIKLTCVPAQHFASRALSDRNKTLWCGFVFETSRGPVYFAGDTGYGSFVEKIAERFTGFRFALIPIGAYLPEFFMSPVHISPSQALQIHRELNVQTSMGIHFGTFRLADDGQDQPIQEIKSLLSEPQNMALNFHILDNGEVLQVE